MGLPVDARDWRAASTIWRMSLTPASTADSDSKRASQERATSRARVVFPVPGGPQRIIECGVPVAINLDSARPSPSRCGWPTSLVQRRRTHAVRQRAPGVRGGLEWQGILG